MSPTYIPNLEENERSRSFARQKSISSNSSSLSKDDFSSSVRNSLVGTSENHLVPAPVLVALAHSPSSALLSPSHPQPHPHPTQALVTPTSTDAAGAVPALTPVIPHAAAASVNEAAAVNNSNPKDVTTAALSSTSSQPQTVVKEVKIVKNRNSAVSSPPPPPPAPLPPSEVSGVIAKKSHGTFNAGAAQRRRFVMSGGSIVYFDGDKEKGRLDGLGNYEIDYIARTPKELKLLPRGGINAKDLELIFDTESECETWKKAIIEHISFYRK